MAQSALQELQALKSAQKMRGGLQGPQRYVAAHLLAQGHSFHDVAAHYKIHSTSLWRMVPAPIIAAAKEEQAQLLAAREKLPELPTIEVTNTGPMMSKQDVYTASHLRAQGFHISDIAAHYGMSESGFNKQVTSAMKLAAKAEQDALIAKGLPLPELPKIDTAISQARKNGRLSRNAEKRQEIKAAKESERSKAAARRKKRKRENDRYHAARNLLALQLVTSGETARDVAFHMKKTIKAVELCAAPDAVAKMKTQWQALQAAGKPLPVLPEIERHVVDPQAKRSNAPKLSALNCLTAAHLLAADKTIEQVSRYYGVSPTNLWMQLAVKLVGPVKAERAELVAAGKQLPPLPQMPEVKVLVKPADKECIAVPLSYVADRGAKLPAGITTQDLWQGFVAHNQALHSAWRNMNQRNSLFGLMLPRYGAARITPEAMLAMGPVEFVRQQSRMQPHDAMRDVFIVLGRKSKKVVGELWHDKSKNGARTQNLHVVSTIAKSLKPSPCQIFMDIGGRREQPATQLMRISLQPVA